MFLVQDHIEPRWKFKYGFTQGNPHAPENLQYICDNCHADKTRIEGKPPLTLAERRRRSAPMGRKQIAKIKAAWRKRVDSGIKFSPEHIQNLSLAMQKRAATPEYRKNSSERLARHNRARKRTAAEQKHLESVNIGRKHSDEWKKNQSEAISRWWAARKRKKTA